MFWCVTEEVHEDSDGAKETWVSYYWYTTREAALAIHSPGTSHSEAVEESGHDDGPYYWSCDFFTSEPVAHEFITEVNTSRSTTYLSDGIMHGCNAPMRLRPPLAAPSVPFSEELDECPAF